MGENIQVENGTMVVSEDPLTMSGVNNKEQVVKFLKEKIMKEPKEGTESAATNKHRRESVKKVIYSESETATKQNPVDMNKLVEFMNKVSQKSDTKSLESMLEAATEFAAGEMQQRNKQDVKLVKAELQKCIDQVKGALEHVPFENLHPFSFLYYMQQQEAVKTPTWKRRKHRFFPSFDHEMLYALHDSLYLAQLAYLDSIPKIQEGLKKYQGTKYPWELLYCNLVGEGKQPAHFICVQQFGALHDMEVNGGAPAWLPWMNLKETYLDVLLVIRGTKEIGDIISNFNMMPVDYEDNDKTKGAKGHEGFIASGKYIVEKHIETIKLLWKESKRSKVRVSIVGHSLGAGTATFVAMELNKFPFIDAKAICFGTPANVNKVLAEKSKAFITSVVCDDDVVPRMSIAGVANMFMDVMCTEFAPDATEDIHYTMEMLRSRLPFKFDPPQKESVKAWIKNEIARKIQPDVTKIPKERLTADMFPAGKCIHLYRDGAGVSATFVPNSFFDEIYVSRTMLKDHYIGPGYDKLFTDLMQQNTEDGTFRFRHDVNSH